MEIGRSKYFETKLNRAIWNPSALNIECSLRFFNTNLQRIRRESRDVPRDILKILDK